MYSEVRVTGNNDEQATWADADDLEVIEVMPGNPRSAATAAPATPPAAVNTPESTEIKAPANGVDAFAVAMGEHDPKGRADSRWVGALLWIALALILCTVAVAAYAYFIDAREAALAPRGVSVAGIDVSGLPADGIREVLGDDIEARRSAEITLRIGDATWPIAVGEYSAVDVDRALAEVFAIRSEVSLWERLKHDLLGESIPRDITYEYSIDREAMTVTVGAIADGLNTEMLNARLKFRDGHPVWEPGRDGVSVDEDTTIADLVEMVESVVTTTPEELASLGDSELTVAVSTQPIPRVRTVDDLLERAIKIDLSAKKLTLYDKDGIVKTWPVATGAPGFPTPEGNFRIVLKRYMPTWGNPGSDWAVDMPDFIPPGPTNPLGLRALNLNAPGIRIHGTSNLASIGTAASHGCVRMTNESIVELYDMVQVGTPVFIVE